MARVLTKLLEPTGGSITIAGKEVTPLSQSEMRPIRRHIQMIFQDPYASLNPRLTALELITEPLVVHEPAMRAAERRDRAVALLRRVGLDAEHLEVKVAGESQQIGLPMGIGAVSPVTCEGDRVVENGIGFAFAATYGDVPLEICWGAAQAAGTLLGLDHVLLAGDVMTYLDGSLPKRFLDETAACGEFAPRSCSCGGTTQNSHQHLLATLPEHSTLAATTAALGALAALAARRSVETRTGERF